MPLTSVVDYLNDRLHELHPGARLGRQAGLRFAHGRLTARVAGFRLTPHQVPVVRTADGQVFARSAQFTAATDQGQRIQPESLYVHAWDADDVVFLDRFLRTFQALHHLNQGRAPHERLAVGVHLRHLSAVPEQHGQVFEDLLARLGLRPDQVVLRLSGPALQQDPHVREAARSFGHRGYSLLATQVATDDVDWALLQGIGVRWVSPSLDALQTLRRRAILGDWVHRAEGHRIGIWLDRITSPALMDLAQVLGAELAEGDMFQEKASLREPVAS